MTRPTARHEDKYQPCPRGYRVGRRRRRRRRSPKYPREYTIALIKAIVIALLRLYDNYRGTSG
ncbi:hypothetical protein [Arthrospira platensis]|uniref:hypothetical protein n=1 Tax=Limnospira platensis TaxID=118562 RepID=UPI000ADDEED4